MRIALLAQALAALAIGSTSYVFAAERFGAFSTVDSDPSVLVLDGEIGVTTALDFRRAMKALPSPKLVILNSPGGTVDTALVVAYQIREKGLSTFVPKGAGCYSACVYLYLAGVARRSDGELGVHQLYNDENDLVAGQTMLSDVLDALDEFGAPQAVISLMLRTPPDSIYVFSNQELAALGLNVGDPFAVGRTPDPPETAALVTPAPSNIIRDLGPENLTVMPKTRTGDDQRPPREEKAFRVENSTPFEDFVRSIGFSDQISEMMKGTLRNVLPSTTLPRGSWVRVLYGPSRATEYLIPYRLSIYSVGTSGEIEHASTIALTDRGGYVIGLPPVPFEVGETLLPGRLISPTTTDVGGGKQDRARPRD